MERKNVFEIINNEREYQKKKYPKTIITDPKLSVAHWNAIIRKYIGFMDEDLFLLNEDGALENIRKIAALCVACMENNETKDRKIIKIKTEK